MIITVLLISFFILFLLSFIFVYTMDKCSTGKIEIDLSSFKIFLFILTLIVGVLLIAAVILIGIEQLPKQYILQEQLYEDLLAKYEAVKDSGSNNNVVIGEIIEYNKTVREFQYRANNPWLSWFVNADRANALKIINI